MRRYPLVALVVLVALLTAAGCGSSKKSSSASPSGNDSTPAATTTAAESPAATTAASETKSSSSSNANKNALARCPELAKIGLKFQAAFAAAQASAKGDPAKQMENAAAVFDKFADSAPEEIRADFKVFGKALKSYAAVLAKVHFKPGKAPTAAQLAELTQASKSISGPEFQKASAHIQAWTQAHCGSSFGK